MKSLSAKQTCMHLSAEFCFLISYLINNALLTCYVYALESAESSCKSVALKSRFFKIHLIRGQSV